MKDTFNLMAKPTGPVCNLKCKYCFYSEKTALFNTAINCRMTDDVLEQYIKKYLTAQDVPEVSFVWQGGEPTLLGVDFFRNVIKLQNKYAGGKPFTNSIQTNGTLLNKEWCNFFAKNKFLVGLSIDGPEEIHDKYRVDNMGKPTFKLVLKSLKLLQKYQVEFNVLTCITRDSAKRPLDIYRFFKELGVKFIQFIPVVERVANSEAKKLGLKLATPPVLDSKNEVDNVTSWSVDPEGYGDFLIHVFDEWVRKDVSTTFIMNFEVSLGAWMGMEAPTCAFARRCGRSMVIEHNGDIYSCDHYVYPNNYLGNILHDMPHKLIKTLKQTNFGISKEEALPDVCSKCKVLFACRGECPKHRFLRTKAGEPGLNYLCKGYKKFFTHIDSHMKAMKLLLTSGYPIENIMNDADALAFLLHSNKKL